MCSKVLWLLPNSLPGIRKDNSVSFKDQYRDFQELVRELMLLRTHNQSFRDNDPQARLLLFAEAAIVLMTLERFLRILPGVQATDGDTLPKLLSKATDDTRRVLELPAKDRKDAIRRIKDVRNTILHGNFEQAARQANVGSVREYFKTQFASEIETLYNITDGLVSQIDPETGRRYTRKKP
jgi:hypothetical protein